MTKIKKILNVSFLFGGVIAIGPIVLSTTSCAKTEWNFTNINEIDNYLNENKVNVSSDYKFSLQDTKNNFDFVRKNVNLQFFVNASLYTYASFPLSKENNLNLKKVDSNTFELSFFKSIKDNFTECIYKIQYAHEHLLIKTNVTKGELFTSNELTDDDLVTLANFNFNNGFHKVESGGTFANCVNSFAQAKTGDLSLKLNFKTGHHYKKSSEPSDFDEFPIEVSCFDWKNKIIQTWTG